MNVSVIIATYNSDWIKLKATILSILMQKNINLQIILADDGSNIKHNDKIARLFNNANFNNFTFSDLKVNCGTVKNLFYACQFIKYEYVKLFSPGDLLFDEYTLLNSCTYIKKNNFDALFGDAVYYNFINNKAFFLNKKLNPNFPFLFTDRKYFKKLFVDYVLANDTILGANLLFRADCLKKYIGLIVDKVKYTEDLMIKIMIFNNLNIGYIDKNLIYYDYGIGISHNKTLKNLIEADKNSIEDIILTEYSKNNDSIVHNKYITYLKNRKSNKLLQKVYKYISYPSILYWKLKSLFFSKMSSLNGDKNYIYNLYGAV